jgi:hypothetical protein
LRIPNALPSLAIPFPNQFRISRECFGRCEFRRIEIAPVTILAAKSWNTAFSRNACASNYENAHNPRSNEQRLFPNVAVTEYRYGLNS